MDTKAFVSRRKKLMKKIKGGMAIIPAAPTRKRSLDTDYPYRQDSNFFYLTGFEEEKSVLILTPEEDKQTHLFLRKKDPHFELWEYKMMGVKAAPKKLGVDAAYPIEELDSFLKKRITKYEEIYIDFYDHFPVLTHFINKCNEYARNKISFSRSIHSLAHLIAELRLIKDSEEIKHLRASCKQTALAHAELMKYAKKGMNEKELQAYLEFEFFKRGANAVAYTSIVGAGNNACTLHYTKNNQTVGNKDLILVDAGGEYNNYATDITRCFPIDTKFTTAQRDIYQVVLNAEKAAIKAVKPGKTLWDLNLIALRELAKGLKELKLTKGSIESIMKGELLRELYPHSLGHWLGIDVHDPGDSQRDAKGRPMIKLKKGMVFTIEPGLYFNKASKHLPKEYKGIGVRIEDDILVTTKGFENLTIDCPKEVKDVEKLREQ